MEVFSFSSEGDSLNQQIGLPGTANNLMDMTFSEDVFGLQEPHSQATSANQQEQPTAKSLPPLPQILINANNDVMVTQPPSPTVNLNGAQNILSTSLEGHVSKLFLQNGRLRSERDDLQRELSFLQAESAVEYRALKEQIASLSTKLELAHRAARPSSLLAPPPNDLQLDSVSEQSASERRRLQLAFEASCVVIQNLKSQKTRSLAAGSSHSRDMDLSVSDFGIAAPIHPHSSGLVTPSACECTTLRSQLCDMEIELMNTRQSLLETQTDFDNYRTRCGSEQKSDDMDQAFAMQIEELEARVLRRTEQIGIHQHDIKRLECNLKLAEDQITDLSIDLEKATADNQCLVEDCATLRVDRDMARDDIIKLENQVETATAEAAAQAQALEATQVALRDYRHSSDDSTQLSIITQLLVTAIGRRRTAFGALTQCQGRAEALLQKSRKLEEGLEAQANHNGRMTSRLNNLLSNQRKQDALVIAMIHQLKQSDDDATFARTSLASKLDDIAELQERISILEIGSKTDSDLRVSALQDDLLLAKTAAAKFETELAEFINSRSRVQREKDDIEVQLGKARSSLADLEQNTRRVDESNNEAVVSLNTRLQELQDMVSELETTCSSLSSDLSKANGECDTLQSQVVAAEEFEHDLQTARQELAHLQEAYDNEVASMQEELQKRDANIENLTSELDTAVASHTEELQVLQSRLDHVEAELETATSGQTDSDQRLEATKADLEECENSIRSLQAEKAELQGQIAMATSRLRDASDLQRQTQTSLQSSEREATLLRSNLKDVREELARASSEVRTTKVDLDLRTARYERSLSNLKQTLAEHQSRPSGQDVIKELEQRIEEMEATLRSKCEEIEENDERFLEVLKEKKKLLAKVDSLNRKIHLQQKQLVPTATATASAPTPPAEVEAPARISVTPSTGSSSECHAIFPRESQKQPVATPITQVTAPSATTGTSASRPQRALPEAPKIPLFELHERTRVASTPNASFMTPPRPAVEVGFTSKTIGFRGSVHPEANVDLSRPSSASRKRPVPDDFDSSAPMPAQAIVASPPHGLRRVVHGIRSGFTPTRNGNSVSPKKKAQSSVFGMSDITNSPRVQNRAPLAVVSAGAVRGKSSWLGKIRGGENDTRMTQNL